LVEAVARALKRRKEKETVIAAVSRWTESRWRRLKKWTKYATIVGTAAGLTLAVALWATTDSATARTRSLADNVEKPIVARIPRDARSSNPFFVEAGQGELIVTGTRRQHVAVMEDLIGRVGRSDADALAALVTGWRCRGFCNASESEVYRKLFEWAAVNFDERPLRECLAEFQEAFDMVISLDETSLKQEGVYTGVDITLKLPALPLHEIFRRMLEPHGCDYFIDGRVLMIVPQEYASKRQYQVFYDVRELVGIAVPEQEQVALVVPGDPEQVQEIPRRVALEKEIELKRRAVPIRRKRVAFQLQKPTSMHVEEVSSAVSILGDEPETYSPPATLPVDTGDEGIHGPPTTVRLLLTQLKEFAAEEMSAEFTAYGIPEQKPFSGPFPLAVSRRMAEYVRAGSPVEIVWFLPANDSIVSLLAADVAVADSTEHELRHLTVGIDGGGPLVSGSASTALDHAHQQGLVVGRMVLKRAEPLD